MPIPAKPGVAGGSAPRGSGTGVVDPKLDELCGSSNPSKATKEEEEDPRYSVEYRSARAFAAAMKANPTRSHHIASSFGDVRLDDEV
ncbi:hypothetical protein D1007_47343 [Hordeum vulgare]|nr:hypothetical protein D1007_47343 [Hordeum vulgare]